MTTKTDITLPLLPEHMQDVAAWLEAHNDAEVARDILNYARSAIKPYVERINDLEADRKGRMPSDDEIIAEFANAQTSDGNADNAWTLYPDELIQAVRTLLSRYSSGQPKPSNSGELGSRPGKSDQCGQPAASAEPPKRPYARSSTLGEYGIIPECDTQPATPASAQAQPVINQQMTTAVDQSFVNMTPGTAAPVAQEPAFYVNKSIIDPKTGKLRGGFGDAITWSDEPAHDWRLPVFLAPVAVPVAAQATIKDSKIVGETSAQDREDDEALADTQRAIIEAAERRGYERAIAECAQLARAAKGADHA